MSAETELEFERTIARVAPARGPATTLSTGQLFASRYEIRGLLGEGGMGAVYKVFDREVEEVVALKVLLGPAAASSEAVERFRREVRLARRVTHRNAARTYDLGEHEGVRFLTMEFVNGRSLSDVLEKRGTLGVGCAASTTAEICDGLAAAHAAEVIHRDLKPANVLVETTGRVVLTDFGIARALQGSEVTLNSTGLMGTPAYMAPEQVSGGTVGPHTDIYAAGMILYETLTGTLPFRGDNAIAMAIARLNEEPVDPRQHAALPDALAELILVCLAREPEKRPASASELGDMLRAFTDGATPPEVSLMTRAGITAHLTGMTTTPRTTDRRWTAALPSERTLAVVPFRFRGKSDDAYLAEALTDELIDILSRTKGLRVSGSGATAKYADKSDRDPRVIGQELGVDVIVDGSVQMAGKRVRINARLEDVSNGFQLWSERFDGLLEDVFELQDKMATRIAEALRIELNNLVHRGEAPAEAIELYLKARQSLKGFQTGNKSKAIDMLERSLALAPAFKPALATHALACLRAWFDPDELAKRDWGAYTRESVARALEQAPELADTHYIAARMKVQLGEYQQAACCLAKALEIAPTCAEVHEYLGSLQCEAGRTKTGMRHIKLAHELDPSLEVGLFDVARGHALHGDLDKFEAVLDELRSRGGQRNLATQILETRVASWHRDTERVRRVLQYIPDDQAPSRELIRRHIRALLCSQQQLTEYTDYFEKLLARPDVNKRFLTVSFQTAAEVMAFHRKYDEALNYITQAADVVLVDVDWINLCPLFEEIRTEDAFRAAVRKVRRRAEGIWRVST